MDVQQTIDNLKHQVDSLRRGIADLETKLREEKETTAEDAPRKLLMHWKPDIGSACCFPSPMGIIHDHWAGLYYELYRLNARGVVCATEDQAIKVEKFYSALVAWNQIAGDYPSGECCIGTSEKVMHSNTWILRKIDSIENAEKAIKRFTESGHTVEDLFMFATEVR
jgi:hypothetical protein